MGGIRPAGQDAGDTLGGFGKAAGFAQGVAEVEPGAPGIGVELSGAAQKFDRFFGLPGAVQNSPASERDQGRRSAVGDRLGERGLGFGAAAEGRKRDGEVAPGVGVIGVDLDLRAGRRRSRARAPGEILVRMHRQASSDNPRHWG